MIVAFGLSDLSFAQTRRPAKRREIITRVPPPPPPKLKTDDPAAKSTGLAIERYVNDIKVESDGTSVQTWDVLQRFKSKSATEKYKHVEKVFNKDLEEVEVSDTYILKPDGRKIPLPSSSVTTRRTPQTEAAPAYSSSMQTDITFDGIEVGDAAHYTFKLRTKKTFFDKEFSRAEYLIALFDWDNAEINLSAPADLPLFTQAIGLDGGRLPDKDGRAVWQWRKIAHKAVEIEPMMLDAVSISPRVMITSFKDFDSLGEAYWKEASKKSVVTPEIKALADEITRDIAQPEQQASAIYVWVNKNIRYLSAVIDRNGWIPHDAGQILANRYGDCKDYTTVLNTLLAAKGIESYPVIIRADMSNWFPDVAVPDYFNHAILYIPSLNLFADATSPNTRLGLIPQQIVGKKAVLAGTKTGIIETPANRPEECQIGSTIKIEWQPNGDLRSTSVGTYKGRSELIFRPLFEGAVARSAEVVPLMLAYYGMTGTGRITKTTNPFRVGEPFEIDVEAELPGYAPITQTGSFRIPVGLNLTNVLEISNFVKAESRKTDLMLGATMFTEAYSIKLPNGVVPELPPNAEFSNSTGRFRCEYRSTKDGVDVYRELVIKKDIVPAGQYSEVRDVITKAAEAFTAAIKYRSANSPLAVLKTGQAAKPPVDLVRSYFEQTYRVREPKAVTPLEAKRLEARLLRDPSDVDARIQLVGYYSKWQAKDTPARAKARAAHRLWLVENRPEISDDYPFWDRRAFKLDSPEYLSLKNAWLKQIEANKTNSAIRTNAFKFLKYYDRALAAKIMMDGLTLQPDEYQYPLLVSQMYEQMPEEVINETPEQHLERIKNELDAGRIALALLKTERSDNRDSSRMFLLKKLPQAAFELNRYDEARSLATELILDFGQSASAYGYDDAAHIGNIILGRVALKQKDINAAKEYLLIAIRAPLRREKSWLGEIDTTLAKELLEAGEKETVIEYLKLCEGLSNLTTEKKLFENQSTKLKLWQEQIRQGKTPTFDFYK